MGAPLNALPEPQVAPLLLHSTKYSHQALFFLLPTAAAYSQGHSPQPTPPPVGTWPQSPQPRMLQRETPPDGGPVSPAGTDGVGLLPETPFLALAWRQGVLPHDHLLGGGLGTGEQRTGLGVQRLMRPPAERCSRGIQTTANTRGLCFLTCKTRILILSSSLHRESWRREGK